MSVSESASAIYAYAAPEARIGRKLGERFEVTAGIAFLALAAIERPHWSDAQPVVAASDGLAKFGSQSMAGTFVFAAVPSLGARYAF